MSTITPPKDIYEFATRARAVIGREADMDDALDHPVDKATEILGYLTSYAQGEPNGEVSVLLNFFKNYLAESSEIKWVKK